MAVLVAVAALLWPVPARAGDARVESGRSATMLQQDWVDDLIDLVEELIDVLEDAGTEAADAETGASLTQAQKDRIRADLDAAQSIIDQILDPEQYPSLDPNQPGPVLATVQPTWLHEYADETVALVREARDELVYSFVIDEGLVASHLMTIEHLIIRETPHSYQTRAGIMQTSGHAH